jgi:hypothetical protein
MRIKWSINNNGAQKNAMTKLIQHRSQQFRLSNLNEERSSRQMLRHQQVIHIINYQCKCKWQNFKIKVDDTNQVFANGKTST